MENRTSSQYFWLSYSTCFCDTLYLYVLKKQNSNVLVRASLVNFPTKVPFLKVVLQVKSEVKLEQNILFIWHRLSSLAEVQYVCRVFVKTMYVC